MELSETIKENFLLLCLVVGSIALVILSYRHGKIQRLVKKINSVPLESLPDMASAYEAYVKERYEVALKDMPPWEHIEYVAAHFKILDRGYKKYFPKGRDWLTIAAAADLGELIRTMCRADWSRSETGSAVPFLEITLPDGEKIACEVFAVFIAQAAEDEDLGAIQRECMAMVNAGNAGIL